MSSQIIDAMFKDNPKALVVVVIALAVFIYFIVRPGSESYGEDEDNDTIKEAFEATFANTTDSFLMKTVNENDKGVIEYFPTSEMNVMYSDINGNLSTTQDLGIKNLTVSSSSKFGSDVGITGNATVGGKVMITGDTSIGGGATIGGKAVITSDTSIGGKAAIAGDATVGGKAIITGDTTIGGGTTIGGNTAIGGNTVVTGDMTAVGNMFAKRNLAVTGDSSVSGNETVNGVINVVKGVNASLGSDGSSIAQFRAKQGNYGTLLRQDGANFYILNTASGNPDGRWSDKRPFYINNASGDVWMGHNVNVGGALTTDRITTGGTSGVGGYTALNNRNVKPNQLAGGTVQFGFGSMANNGNAPWSDFIHFNGWGDGTGGNPNLVMFNKNGIGMRIYQGGFNSGDAYSSFKDAVLTDSTGNTVLSGGTAFAPDGRITIAGDMSLGKLNVKNPNGSYSHLGWIDNNNYLRGFTVIDGGNVVNGDSTINGSFWVRKNNYLYYPDETTIYQNIFDALSGGVISKYGNPSGWDETSYRNSGWYDYYILRIGSKNAFPNGLRVNVPAGKKVIWLRCLNDRWLSVQLYKLDGTNLGNFCSGMRKSHNYAPDGGSHDSSWDFHTWFPIPVPDDNASYVFTSGNSANDGGSDAWISGIAFSTNPWNHAYNCAVANVWQVNGGSGVTWNSDNWNNDMLGQITNGNEVALVVPIVPSGRDKLFYIAEHNANWDGAMHRGLKVDDTPIERLRTTWDHPLARTLNSKMYYRFLAARIPESLTRGKRFITVKVNMTGDLRNHIFFREAGTIDMY